MAATRGLRHLSVMLWKNMLLVKRHWILMAIQLILPAFFILFLNFERQSVIPADLNPNPFDLTHIPRCKPIGDHHCYTILSTPDHPDYNAVMKIIADEQGLSFGSFGNQNIDVAYDSAGIGNMSQWILENPGETLIAVNWFVWDLEVNKTIEYDIIYNSTYGLADKTAAKGEKTPLTIFDTNILALFTRSLQRGIATHILRTQSGQADASVDMKIQTKDYPQLATYPSAMGNVVASGAPILLFIAAMFVTVLVVYQLVTEKQEKLRMSLHSIGLSDFAFWGSWYVMYAVITLIQTVGIMIAGHFMGFEYFTMTSPLINFCVFYLFNFSMFVLALLLSSIIPSAKVAIISSMMIFLLGVLLMMGLTQSVQFVYSKAALRAVLRFYAPLNLAHALWAVAQVACTHLEPGGGGKIINAQFYTWDKALHDPTYAIASDLLYFGIDILIYGIVAWFMDNFLAGAHGSGRPPWFFLTLDYWGFGTPQIPPKKGIGQVDPAWDEDVVAEVRRVLSRRIPGTTAVRIVDVGKTFKGRFSFLKFGKGTDGRNRALDRMSLSVEENSVFGLLGHNGAGKTTLINILTGAITQSNGFASVFNYCVKTQKETVREIMGLCPQHDVLWNEFTAREHLILFARLKGVPEKKLQAVVDEKLREVELSSVGDNAVGTFSGGMKRRLTVSISLIGNPRVVFMDEPTTGLDPVNRRKVWSMIQKAKQGRVIILTTHSMEEADVLSDRIGIMAYGKLRCLGNSVHLKNRYGVGYRIDLETTKTNVSRLHEFVGLNLKESVLVGETGGHVTYGVPREILDRLPGFFEMLEESVVKEPDFIKDWGIYQTTLEEVFLFITATAFRMHNPPEPPTKPERKTDSQMTKVGDVGRIRSSVEISRAQHSSPPRENPLAPVK